MAALLRRVTSLGQLILQFMRCVIFHREKDKEDELQRKISVAKEETFFDICGFKESDEHSTTDRECGSSKGRDQALAVEKKSRPRKKKRLRKNKISPAERVAWEECGDGKSAKKSHAPLKFTSRSSKASNLKSDFSKSSYRDNYNGKLYQHSSFCQNEKEKIRAPKQTTDDGCYGQKDFLAWKKNKSENPGSSAWHDNESDVNPSSGSVDAKENFKFPFSLWSKVSWKNVLGKSKEKTTEYCIERCTANDDLCEQGVIQGDTESKQSSPQDLHGPECSGSREFIEEALNVQDDRRSKFPLRWKKKRKTKNSGIEQLHPGFQNLKKSLDLPNSIRSKLLKKWRNVRHRERKGSEMNDSCENVQGLEVVAASVRESDSVNTKKQCVDCLEPPQSSSSDKKKHLDVKSDSWRKSALRWRRGKKAEKPGIERLHPGFQNLRKTLEKPNNVRSRIVQNVGKVLERMDKGLQEIGVGENQMMKEDLETTHDSSAGSGEQPRVRPISEMAFRRKPQKTGVERLYPGFQNLKKNLDHPNSFRSKIEKGLRHLRGGTKAKRSGKEESEVQMKIPNGKDKSPKSGSQQLYTGLENLKKSVEQPKDVRSNLHVKKLRKFWLSRYNERFEKKDSQREN